MERIGRIIRISGSLVVAEGIPSPQMYEVVEVGNERLIGEIIRISGERAYIQVYETTSGLRPGDPVYATGSPLSAELGPGLIGQIFDGIQRPLSKIVEKTGSIYVRRGVKLPALPRDARYRFIPSEKISRGTEVGPGDVLGYVDETPLIRHPIIVPPDTRGRLIELSPEGDYTVEDPIAYIESRGERIPIRMMSRWPVRRPRPYRAKLEPTLPLITGMRIIDTLFPMAKGGTGAIPGAFGTGKCLLPGTPVLLGSGRLVPIEKIFYKVKGGPPDPGLEEEIYGVGSKKIYVYSFNGRTFVKTPVSHVYRGRTDRIVEIRTRRGRVIRVTPLHRLLVFDRDRGVIELPAVSIRRGDLIVVPRRLALDTKATIDLYKYMPEFVARDERLQRKFIKLVKRLAREKGVSIEKLAEELGIEPRKLYTILNWIASPPLWLVREVFKRAGLRPPHPEEIAVRWSRESIKIPREIDGFFAYLLGMIYGNGIIHGRNTIRIYIPYDDLDTDTLRDLMKYTFGYNICDKISVYWTRQRDFYGRSSVLINIRSTVLAELVKRLGFATQYFVKRDVPHIILRASDSAIYSFLAGYFRASGFYKEEDGKIYLVALTKEARDVLTYLLTRVGIGYRVLTGLLTYKKSREIYVVVIERLYDIVNFVENVLSREVLSVGPVLGLFTYMNRVKEKLFEMVEEIKKRVPAEILPIPEEVLALYTGSSMSTTSTGVSGGGLQSLLLSKTGAGVLKSLARLGELFREIDVDPVESVEVRYGEWDVYDVTVPGLHNFVGGETPTIFHNTVTLHSLAMWSDARVVIYIGCGERGNEMTEVLERFPESRDPWTGRPLMERTILIANTSNMPVSAREASIYVGITLAEYYRDLGYDVLLVADSTSRWAEALREISSRLEEMPAEEGYPSYLQSRLAEFYERAGRVVALGTPERTGSVTVIGAVSPPGGDFTEPVTTHTRRFIRVFWALDASLAYSRHYPAINWITSYSAYTDLVSSWWAKNVDPSWRELRDELMNILLRENELREVVRLVGVENLPEPDKLVMEVARMIRDGFLRQNAYDPIDAFSSPEKQFRLMKLLITFYRLARPLVESGVPVKTIREKTQALITEIVKARFSVRNEEIHVLDELEKRLVSVFEELRGRSL